MLIRCSADLGRILVGTRLQDLRRFYLLLDELEGRIGGKRLLENCTGRLDWPRRGVYFFFENGESRAGGSLAPRVVRIGTHALKAGSNTRLWSRLAQHRGSVRQGSGNHRSSIFRLIVGNSLIHRDDLLCESWGDQSATREIRKAEREIEMKVSATIGKMPFLWVDVDDDTGPESDRGVIERGSIALVSNWNKDPIDAPSSSWLGHFSCRVRVRRSGLWNNNHVDESYTPGFLDVLERHVRRTG